MKIAVCDDCLEDGLYLKTLLDEHSVNLYSNAEQLMEAVKDNEIPYDLYLIDIYLDAMNGIELAKCLREKDEDASICFISSSDAFYREAYDLYAVQYLLKPVVPQELKKLVSRVAGSQAKNRELALRFKWRGKIGSIPCRKILFVSSREHKLYIYCKDGNIQECIGKMDEIADQICGETFLRVHQSFVVNMHCVDSLNGSELVVAEYRIPISRRYLSEVKKRYQEILFEEMI